MCCSMEQRISEAKVRCSVLLCVAVCCCVLLCVAVCCSVEQRISAAKVSRSVLLCTAVSNIMFARTGSNCVSLNLPHFCLT